MYVRLLLAASILALAGCGKVGSGGTGGGGGSAGGSGGGTGGGSGGGGGGDALGPDEMAAFDHGSDTTVSSQNAFQLADSLFQFDPTLDVVKTAAQNATAIQTETTTQLAGCGSATVASTTVTVNFGPPPGCTLVNGTVASGSATLGVSASGGTLTVAMTFTNLVVNGTGLTGNASFATTNATTFAVTGSLTSGSNATTYNLTVVGTATAMTIDGTSSAVKSGTTTALTFTGVKLVKKDCYPSAGTIKYVKGLITETVTFLSTTPMDGKVTVKIGLRTSTVPLPTYGSCPPPKDGG